MTQKARGRPAARNGSDQPRTDEVFREEQSGPNALLNTTAQRTLIARNVPEFYGEALCSIDQRRLLRHFSQAELNDRAGVADGYFAKALYPSSPGGRLATWATVSEICRALWPNGYRVLIIGADEKTSQCTCGGQGTAVNPDGRLMHWRNRAFFRELGRRGGLRSAEVRRARKEGK